MLAGAAREENRNKGGGGQVKLSNVDTRGLSGLENKLMCCFKLVADMFGGGTYIFSSYCHIFTGLSALL